MSDPTPAPTPDRVPAQAWSDLPLDQVVALKSAAARLAEQFTGIFGAETIERFLHTSFDHFADRATVATFLPLMAERFARQRLRALAKVEGLHDDGKPTVLFLCTHNAGRSQMALGFFTHLADDAAIAWSGGSEPGVEVNPASERCGTGEPLGGHGVVGDLRQHTAVPGPHRGDRLLHGRRVLHRLLDEFGIDHDVKDEGQAAGPWACRPGGG